MTPPLGCVIVTYNAATVIQACLDSLARARDVELRVVVVDNASMDQTAAIVEAHAMAVTLIRAGSNRGFAAGVNLGLAHLQRDDELDRYWVLNPDCVVPPDTPAKLARAPQPFALLGNRLLYGDDPDRVQIDAGTINRWTGATGNLNLGARASVTPLADATDADFVSGASMTVSRNFLEAAGPMPDEYFLYYEEVHWAQMRGDLPLALCPDAPVLHAAGSSIGSATLQRGPSALSVYFKHRARLRFVAWHRPLALLPAYLFGLGKAVQHLARGEWAALPAVLRALHGLPPSRSIRALIEPDHEAAAKSRSVSSRPV